MKQYRYIMLIILIISSTSSLQSQTTTLTNGNSTVKIDINSGEAYIWKVDGISYLYKFGIYESERNSLFPKKWDSVTRLSESQIKFEEYGLNVWNPPYYEPAIMIRRLILTLKDSDGESDAPMIEFVFNANYGERPGGLNLPTYYYFYMDPDLNEDNLGDTYDANASSWQNIRVTKGGTKLDFSMDSELVNPAGSIYLAGEYPNLSNAIHSSTIWTESTTSSYTADVEALFQKRVANIGSAGPIYRTFNGALKLLVPEIVVEQPSGNGLVAGSSIVNFGSIGIGLTSVPREFNITNTGENDLIISSITTSDGNAADFFINSSGLAGNLAPGKSTTFTVTCSPSVSGMLTTNLHIENNDRNEGAFHITLNANGIVPDISIENPEGTALTTGDTTVAFGNIATGSPFPVTFTIRNLGDSDLTVMSAYFVTGDTADFAVTHAPASIVAAEGRTTFTVTLTPAAEGVRTTVLRVVSNDPDESPFEIRLTGNGVGAVALYDDTMSRAGLSGDVALPFSNPFNDNIPNLLKYAFNMNLTGPDISTLTPNENSGLPAVSLDENGADRVLRIEFVRRKGSGLVYTPQYSNGLDSFAPLMGVFTITDVNAHWERVVVEGPCDPAFTLRCFGRVAVELP